MNEVAIARINTFGPSPKADSVPPSEQTISLSYGQLQELIKEAVEQAIEPLHEEIAQDRQEIEALRSTVAPLRPHYIRRSAGSAWILLMIGSV